MALALARCAICTEAREERRSDDYFDEQVSYNDNNNSNTNNNCFLIIYIYIYIYICIYTCVYVYIYIYRERERKSDLIIFDEQDADSSQTILPTKVSHALG